MWTAAAFPSSPHYSVPTLIFTIIFRHREKRRRSKRGAINVPFLDVRSTPLSSLNIPFISPPLTLACTVLQLFHLQKFAFKMPLIQNYVNSNTTPIPPHKWADSRSSVNTENYRTGNRRYSLWCLSPCKFPGSARSASV